MSTNLSVISKPLRSLLLVGASVLLIPIAGCGDSVTAESTGGTDMATISAGHPGNPSGFPGSGGAQAGPGAGPGTGHWPGTPGASSGPGDPGWPGMEPGGSDDGDDDSDDLRFTFVLPGASEPLSARVVGGNHGDSIVIDNYPTSYTFKLTYGPLPMGYPDAINAEFCDGIEDHVKSVEAGHSLSERSRQHLRELYSPVIVRFWFGTLLTTDLLPVARDAAVSAGALSSNLRITNGPKFQDLTLDVSFANNSLTRRMGDHEKARQAFQNQLAGADPIWPSTGMFVGGTSFPDFLCDLHSNRAQVTITTREQGWSSVAQSKTIVPQV